ncbi:hypothetical protein HPB47_021965 [Ixodes persulcatus]|uniref:Uncharacterized protein n=1 Tax=Ixodes persulcatus TaxID=34615 RepID=A0AC60QD83_IXOPE|nr:hypothetical protein HPB47_021965 [Ixodes persulcatus]
MFNVPEFTTHSWGEALRCRRTKPRKVPRCRTNERSDVKFFRNTDRHSLGTLLGSRCTSSTRSLRADLRRSGHGDARRSPPMVTLRAWVQETSGKGNAGHPSRMSTPEPASGDVRDQARIRKPGSAGRLGEVRRLKNDSGHLGSAGSQPPRLLLLAAVGCANSRQRQR